MDKIIYDKYQLQAIKCDKNVLLLAGAGCGKTTTIIGKINYLLSNGYEEKDILCISFTNASVNDLKNKLNNNIDVLTFHKLAMKILKQSNYDYSLADANLLNNIIDKYIENLFLYKKKKKKFIKYVKNINSFKKLAQRFINLYKANNYDSTKLKEIFLKISKIKQKDTRLEIYMNYINILNIYKQYSNELKSSNDLDFDDLIITAYKMLKNKKIFLPYKYIIIDEFQDTSFSKLELIQLLYKKYNTKIFCVGDDFQSIYQFTGCDLNIFLNFKKYFNNSCIKKLKYTYRNPQELITVAGNFIMKNKKQLKKNMISHKRISKPIIFVDRSKLKKLLNILKDKTYFIIGRNNNDIYNYLDKKYILDNNINYITIHKSKGLEADNIIIINLTNKVNGLPSNIQNNYLIDLLLHNKNDIYNEERRLFYVALTRTKNKVYLIIDKNFKSPFIKEIYSEYRKYISFYK